MTAVRVSVNTTAEDLTPTLGEGDGTKENPISYARFVNMFLPVLLERYDETLKSVGETALYEKVAPVLYWKPPNVHGEHMEVNKMEFTTEVASPRHTVVVETKAKFDYGKDVLVCNLMTPSKELQGMTVETLHRNYDVDKEVKIEPHLLCNEGDPAGWETNLSQMMDPRNREKLLEGVVWYDFRATLVAVLEKMVPQWLPEVPKQPLILANASALAVRTVVPHYCFNPLGMR